ncbi:SDR family NAD(P)-dependent oxidoreductase [Halomarina oriensis]|uniref:Glucose 1-dehydrogenase n=1 Tax=Halomarina oriensis TaxID=671145 RepID=A0A6B0GW79_9EURY|nr:glucose 1-dehydrogenase [Halomarina oriensis]MWG36405.1 glucose 1-dehydrogenase [Halomarina oriensis]
MTLDAFSLAGSVVIVTGGSRGIGEETAVAMAEAGADVAAVARSEGALEETVERIEGTGSSGVARTVDVTDDDAVAGLVDSVADELGPVDVLVNNAGTNPYFGDTRKLDTETFEHITDVNTTGAFRCTKAFARHVADHDGTGVVVNVASVGGVVGLPYQAPYTASKHAMVGLTKSLAVEWAPDIRVNALAPGYVTTEFTKGVRENDSIREDLLSNIPADRFADPEELAYAAVYLASPAAAYATGEVHVVDGGMTAR